MFEILTQRMPISSENPGVRQSLHRAEYVHILP
jgi:hypothetical protein